MSQLTLSLIQVVTKPQLSKLLQLCKNRRIPNVYSKNTQKKPQLILPAGFKLASATSSCLRSSLSGSAKAETTKRAATRNKRSSMAETLEFLQLLSGDSL